MKTFFTHFQQRKLEWALAVSTSLFGALIALPMESMRTPGYKPVLDIMPEMWWGLTYMAAGVTHIYALHINGRAWWTPFARLFALFISMQVFTAFAFGFSKGNAWSTATLWYGIVAVIYCGTALWYAALDCGKEYKIWIVDRKGR